MNVPGKTARKGGLLRRSGYENRKGIIRILEARPINRQRPDSALKIGKRKQEL